METPRLIGRCLYCFQMKISIITPTLNRNYIENAWRCLERQTDRAFEWIIVDNGSDREHLKTLDSIARQASFKVVLASESLRGPSACRKKGESLAEGDFFAYLDDDDEYSQDAIAQWRADVEENSCDVSVLRTFNCVYKCLGRKFVFERNNADLEDAIATKEGKFDIALKTSFPRMLYRREFVEKSGSWDLSLRSREDIDFMTRILLLEPKVTMTRAGSYDCLKTTGVDKYIKREFAESVLRSFKKIYGHTKDTYIGEKMRKYLGADTRNRWRKISLFYPDLGEEYKAFAQMLGYSCSDSLLKRRFLRAIKAPARNFPLLSEIFYYKLRNLTGKK